MSKKISELTAYAAAEPDDLFVVVDNDTNTTKKILAPNIIAPGTIKNAGLNTDTGELGGSWQSWTPTYSNLTVGNGTVIAKYIQVGKIVHARFTFTLGSTSSIGSDPRVSMPVNASSEYITGHSIGISTANDASPSTYYSGNVWFIDQSGTHRFWPITHLQTGGTYANSSGYTSSVPFTWTTNDKITFTATYEAA